MKLAAAYLRARLTTLPMLIIYDKPADAPESVIVRLFEADAPTALAWRFGSVKAARDAIPDGLFVIPRSSADEPQIVETWL